MKKKKYYRYFLYHAWLRIPLGALMYELEWAICQTPNSHQQLKTLFQKPPALKKMNPCLEVRLNTGNFCYLWASIARTVLHQINYDVCCNLQTHQLTVGSTWLEGFSRNAAQLPTKKITYCRWFGLTLLCLILVQDIDQYFLPKTASTEREHTFVTKVATRLGGSLENEYVD